MPCLNAIIRRYGYFTENLAFCHTMLCVIVTSYHLTHWGRVTLTCVSKQIIYGSDNGLSPSRRQAIIWTNAGILLIGPMGTKFNEILIEIQTFSFKKMHLKMSSGKWRPFCLRLNVLTACQADNKTHFHECMAWRGYLSENKYLIPTIECTLHITLISHERHGVSIHLQINGLFIYWCQLTTNENSKIRIISLLWGLSTGDRQATFKKGHNMKNVCMTWRHHDISWSLLSTLFYLDTA